MFLFFQLQDLHAGFCLSFHPLTLLSFFYISYFSLLIHKLHINTQNSGQVFKFITASFYHLQACLTVQWLDPKLSHTLLAAPRLTRSLPWRHGIQVCSMSGAQPARLTGQNQPGSPKENGQRRHLPQVSGQKSNIPKIL